VPLAEHRAQLLPIPQADPRAEVRKQLPPLNKVNPLKQTLQKLEVWHETQFAGQFNEVTQTPFDRMNPVLQDTQLDPSEEQIAQLVPVPQTFCTQSPELNKTKPMEQLTQLFEFWHT